MRMLATLILAIALLFLAVDGLLADEEKPEGGSKFDEPGEPEEEVEAEPKPATYTLKDYKLEMKVEDGRFWKHNKKYTEKDEKANVVLKLVFKLPKSESHFDVNVVAQGWAHNLVIDFGGKKVGAQNYKKLCDIFYENDMEKWKDVKSPEKPKTTKIGKRIKCYRYALTGTPEGWSMPVRKVNYFFKFSAKTYLLSVLYTTTAARTERITKEVDALLKSLKERKTRRR